MCVCVCVCVSFTPISSVIIFSFFCACRATTALVVLTVVFISILKGGRRVARVLSLLLFFRHLNCAGVAQVKNLLPESYFDLLRVHGTATAWAVAATAVRL